LFRNLKFSNSIFATTESGHRLLVSLHRGLSSIYCCRSPHPFSGQPWVLHLLVNSSRRQPNIHIYQGHLSRIRGSHRCHHLVTSPHRGCPTSTAIVEASPTFWDATGIAIFSLTLTGGTQHQLLQGVPHPPCLLGGHRHRHLLHSSSMGAPAFSATRDASPALWAATDATIFPATLTGGAPPSSHCH
jgi:hypothetical protein